MAIPKRIGTEVLRRMDGTALKTVSTTITFARNLDDVLLAWRLVYRCYRYVGLIPPNHDELHTVAEAMGRRTLVAVEKEVHAGDAACLATLSCTCNDRLALDRYFGRELDELRSQGRMLAEVGLHAGRGDAEPRPLHTMLQLMSMAYWFARSQGADDLLIGVPPRHALFYHRFFGAEQLGRQRRCPDVLNNPARLLRLNITATAAHPPRQTPGLAFFLRHATPPAAFHHRYRFPMHEMFASALAPFAVHPPKGRTSH